MKWKKEWMNYSNACITNMCKRRQTQECMLCDNPFCFSSKMAKLIYAVRSQDSGDPLAGKE